MLTIPSYNNEKTIKDAINSLKKQSYRIEDIFIIDDGSLIKQLKSQNCGVKVFFNQKIWVVVLQEQKAMQLAKHDIVVCCDATNELDC